MEIRDLSNVIVSGISLVSNAETPAVPKATTKFALLKTVKKNSLQEIKKNLKILKIYKIKKNLKNVIE